MTPPDVRDRRPAGLPPVPRLLPGVSRSASAPALYGWYAVYKHGQRPRAPKREQGPRGGGGVGGPGPPGPAAALGSHTRPGWGTVSSRPAGRMRNRVSGIKVKATRESPQGSVPSPSLPRGHRASEVSPGSEARGLCLPFS